MKNFKITVTDQKTKALICEFNQLSNTKKYLVSKMRARYQFRKPAVTIKIERLVRTIGVQTDLKSIFDEPTD